MKKIGLSLMAACMVMIMAIPVLAAKKRASIQWGAELYKDAGLGGSLNKKSCFSCHEGDRNFIKKVLDMSKDDLSTAINRCIAGPMEAKQLDPSSEEMRSLRMYLNSLSQDCY